MITVNQEIHRAYLQSPVWAEKRKDALAYYGCVCQKCGEYGNDVHHKTYKRTGGQELMRDLMVLCRSCHEAIHAAERSQKTQGIYRPERKIHRQAIFRYLNYKMKSTLCKKYNCDEKSLYIKVYSNQDEESIKITKDACKMIGFDSFFEPKKPKRPGNVPKRGNNVEKKYKKAIKKTFKNLREIQIISRY